MSHVSRLNNERGYITVLTLALGAICGVLLLQMLSYSVTSRKQVLVSRDLARFSSLLDSIIDYTEYGLKNRWCFDANWAPRQQADCGLGPNLNSSEALLLTRDAYKTLVDISRRKGTPLTAIDRSGVISATVDVKQLAVGHPLFKAVSGLLKSSPGAIDSIYIQAKRIFDNDYPIRGDEALVRITVTLNPGGLTNIFGNFKSLSASSLVVISPRELNYFTLIVPQDLRLDGQGGGSGDFSIPTGTGGAGITFMSPVFVNRNIHLPNGGFTSASFQGKVYLGQGDLYRGGVTASPATPGGKGDQLYSEMSTFGGFSRGIDIDDRSDDGLKIFAGIMAGAPPSDADRMGKCRELALAEMDLSRTADSDLLYKPMTARDKGIDVRLGLTKYNLFTDQGYGPRRKRDSDTGTPQVPVGMTDPVVMAVKATVQSVNGRGIPNPAKTLSYDMGPQTLIPNLGLGAQNFGSLSTGGVHGDNALEFHLDLGNGPNVNRITAVTLTFQAMDVGFFGGQDRRLDPSGQPTPKLTIGGYSRTITLNYSRKADGLMSLDTSGDDAGNGYLKAGGGSVAQGALLPEQQIMGQSYRDFRASCKVQTSGSSKPISSAFEPGDWDPENLFLSETLNSWSFTNPLANDPVQSATNPSFTSVPTFMVHSIAPDCTIPAGVSFVSGFFVCKKFVIADRSTPLTFVGTMIAKDVSIASSAIIHGVKFMSIYHPTAVYLLRQQNVLNDFNGNACPNIPAVPVWHPEPDPITAYNLQSCNVTALRKLADPFTWTTFTPDCGVSPTAGQVSCRRRPLRFLLREVSRLSDLQ